MSSWPSLCDGSLDILRHITQGVMILQKMFTTIFGDDNTSLGKNTRITLNHSILDKGIRTSSKHLEKPRNSTSGNPKSNSLAHYLFPWNYVVALDVGQTKSEVYIHYMSRVVFCPCDPYQRNGVVLFPISLVASKIICLNHISPTSKQENLCGVLRSGQWHEVQNFIHPEIAKSVFGRLLSFVGGESTQHLLKRHKVSSSGVFYLLNSYTICDV